MKYVITLFIFLPFTGTAQTNGSDPHYLIYLLGKDTTMAGKYQLHNNNFNLEVISRPVVTKTIMQGHFFPNGELQDAEGSAYKIQSGKEETVLATYRVHVKGDTTFFEIHSTGKDPMEFKFPGKGMIGNATGAAFPFFLAFWPNYAPKGTGDSLISAHFSFGSKRQLIVKRISPTSIRAGSNLMGYHTLITDSNGRLKQINGIGSSWNELGYALDHFDLADLARRFLADEESGRGLSFINAGDTVRTAVNGIAIQIIYSRPSVRGRTIFGEVVPWNRIWRTGANAATRIVIDRPIHFGDKVLAAGEYSLWTLPSKNGWTLIFNSQSRVWGTDHNPAYDVLQIPMKVEPLAEPVEMMTITIESAGNGGTLNILWENTKATVFFLTPQGR